jgi:flagellar basal body P-ring formation protein FlgA
MIRISWLICGLLATAPLATAPALADIVVPVRTIPAGQIIGLDDLLRREGNVQGAIGDPDQILGMEARIALYAGRPIRQADVGQPAVIERNQIVPLVYTGDGLHITTEGRALDRAGPGDVIRVMNMTSRNTVTAWAGADGAAYVSRQGE